VGILAPYGDVLQTLRLNLIGWTVTRNRPALFRGRHLEDAIILRCVRSYLRYSLRYRDLEEMMAERGLSLDDVTIWRWVQHYAPILNQRLRREVRHPNRSWQVDETTSGSPANGLTCIAVDSGPLKRAWLRNTQVSRYCKRPTRRTRSCQRESERRLSNIGIVSSTIRLARPREIVHAAALAAATCECRD
jgi:hypothetical protein